MTQPNITDGQIAIDPINRIFYYLDSDGNLVNASLNLLQDSSTQISTEEDLVVSGNLRITGNTTILESTITSIKDPIITLGGNTAPTLDDNKDRGIEFRWHNGTSAKVGFFGFDDSSGKFTFIPDATNTSEVFSGTVGELAAKLDWDNILNKPTFVNSITGTPFEVDVTSSTGTIVISLPTTINVNITGTAAGWTTPRKITLGGDLSGEVLIDGGSNVTLNANVVANSVALGTDTTGDYVANLISGTGITITNGNGEQSQPTISVTNNTYDAYGAASTAEINAYNNAVTYVNNQLSSIELTELSDVTITSATPSHFLKYNGSQWVNGPINLDILSDVNIPLPGDGQVLAYDSASGSWISKSTLDLTIPTGVQYTELLGNNTDVEFTVTHGLTTDDPFVVVLKKNASNNFEVVNALWEVSSNTQIKVYFETPPTTANAKVIVFGDVATASVLVSSLSQLNDVSIAGSSSGEVLYKSGAFWTSKALYLQDLEDVQSTNAATPNQFLKYNGSAWVASTINEVNTLNDILDAEVSSPINGQLLQYDGTNWVNSTPPSGEPMGFEDRTDSTISLSTRTFTISPVSGSYTVWCKGKRYVKTTHLTTTISDTSGLHYIYFDSNGNLANKTTFFDFENEAPVAYIYWNSGGNTHHFFADERHGIVMDWATHEYLHRTRGAAIASGFGANNYSIVGNGSSNAHAQISIADGVFFDEDIEISITHSASPTANTWEQRLQNGAYIPMFYQSGNAWIKDTATQYPLKQGTARAQYNLNTGGTWSTVDLNTNKFGITWIVATNNLNEPVIGILGQDSYNAIGDAEQVDWSEMSLTGFPIVEFRPLYRIIYQTNEGYTNTPHAKFVAVTDMRTVMTSGGGVPTTPVSDHGSMTGLGDNDHPQYLLVDDHDTRDHSAALSTAVLDDLSDVTITSATPNHYLRYNGSQWVNEVIALGTNTSGNYVVDVSAGTGISVSHTQSEGSTATVSLNASLDTLSDVTITSATPNHFLQYNGSAWVNQSLLAETSQIANSAVTTAKIADDAVTQDKVADRAIGSSQLDNISLNAQTGTTYTLALADAQKLVTLNNASPITVTVPLNSSIEFEIGDQINLLQIGAGQVTISPAVGVTVRSEGSRLKIKAQYAIVTLVKIGTDEWVLIGNTAS